MVSPNNLEHNFKIHDDEHFIVAFALEKKLYMIYETKLKKKKNCTVPLRYTYCQIIACLKENWFDAYTWDSVASKQHKNKNNKS